MEIITRQQARQEGLKYYFTGKPCKHGHVCKRYVSDLSCVDCNNKQKRAYYAKNKQKCLSNGKRWMDKLKKSKPEQIRKYNNNWYANRVDKDPSYRKIKQRRSAKYRAVKLEATPKWFFCEEEQINLIYEQCNVISLMSGIKHHVDHIVPLQGENVCGLHCLCNLQILTAEDNERKGNTFDNS